ncbi:putative pyrophosphatase or phosphodiesterase, AlkP superfamily [Fodinibius salinus]|uniref:Putative pyrophosphatase or phosphodiesterase, AlkP superfamily n=1 Tax=Fodinibius salinus TaxID=860790 RepID=A0A5D3YFY7_9BACT|nr:alkaline phosphatase PafA [Fodinibius salinus]TYP92135.1 putative pyrophosphatase or phosphodiesterase, AlkP superfamily [Fodinibius salinus]
MRYINKSILILLTFCLVIQFGCGQKNKQTHSAADQPKLVVSIVVDQMRYDYLPLYWDKFEEDGFKRLIQQGFSFENNHFNYFPTYTGPGHAAVYTGTTPSANGIVGNAWYDRSINDNMYVVADSTVNPVGTDEDMGKMSPANLLSTTVTDELKNVSPESKVIGVSIKDRGAVLPAGHLADGAYWYEDATGHFVSSSWYGDKLPQWLQEFNDNGMAKKLSRQSWETLLPIEEYTESNADDTPYEGTFDGEDEPVFPHAMDSSTARIQTSPFGNKLTAELAQKAIKGASLGSDNTTDFLTVSFSSTDYVGHQFGPHSIELQDTYLRLDNQLADLLNYLDQQVGKGNYLVMLTSDHGVVDVPAELKDKNLPGGYFDSDQVLQELSVYLADEYGSGDWIESYINQQVYLDRNLIAERGISLKEIQRNAANFLLQFEGVRATNTAYNYQQKSYAEGQQAMHQRGFMYDRSGDVSIQLKSGWLDSDYPTGTSHSSTYSYDTHVPLIFYGWNVPQGRTDRRTVIPQIAPTISNMLNISMPSGSPANVLQFEE